MFDMLLWFAVVMVLFAVGDVVAKLTKARISSVFATLMLFLILFVAGVLPADIIEKAGLSAASSWSVPMLLFAMGSMINLRQFMDEWRTVVTCWFGMLAVIIGVSLTIPIIGKEMALSAIPVVNGALPATQIMTEAATKAGYPLAAALAAITFAVQKFVGTPFASSASLRYAQGLIGEYRKAKSSGTLDEFMAAAGIVRNAIDKHLGALTFHTLHAVRTELSAKPTVCIAHHILHIPGLSVSLFDGIDQFAAVVAAIFLALFGGCLLFCKLVRVRVLCIINAEEAVQRVLSGIA